jgi:hypothetical protein
MEVNAMNWKNIVVFSLLSIITLIFPQFIGAKDFAKVNIQSAGFQANKKIAISEIEGYGEAVGILKDALANSLLEMYNENEKNASYTISGNVFAKKHWRKRIYVYHTVNLRMADKNGNVVMSVSNTEPMWQTDLTQFTDEIAKSLRESLQETPLQAASPQEATKPMITSIESSPLQNGMVVHVFQKSPKEQIRATVGNVEGKTYLDLRVFNQVAQFNYVPTDMGLTIPAELLPELQTAVQKFQQTMAQSK